jgi:hypothetical protein
MADALPSVTQQLTTVAVQGYQFLYNADRFKKGQIPMGYHPEMRHGEIIRVGNFIGYVEGFEHTITQMPDGIVEARTVVTYVRGLNGEKYRTYADPDVAE